MIRDFSLMEIPFHDSFLSPIVYPPAAISTWHRIIEEAEKILSCVKYGQPGWASDGLKGRSETIAAPIGVFFWGRTSEIAKEYLEPDPEQSDVLSIANGTASAFED